MKEKLFETKYLYVGKIKEIDIHRNKIIKDGTIIVEKIKQDIIMDDRKYIYKEVFTNKEIDEYEEIEEFKFENTPYLFNKEPLIKYLSLQNIKEFISYNELYEVFKQLNKKEYSNEYEKVLI